MIPPSKIFIVEDEKLHYELLVRSIQKEFPNVSIGHFDDASALLEHLDIDTPDLMIVDYQLPGMNGIEFIGALKEKHINVPTIMITGQGDEQVAVEAMKLGAYDYLVKSGSFFTLVPSVIKKTLEQKRIQDDLWEAKQRFEAIYNHGGLGISIVDKQGNFIEVNRMFCEILGYNEQELKSMSISDITHEKDIIEGLQMKKRLWSGALKTYQREKRYIRQDGGEVWVMVTAVAVFGKPEAVKYVIGLVQDITLRKRDEEMIRQLYYRIVSTQENERKNIADKLHDDLGQLLTVLKIGLDQLKIQWPSESQMVNERIDGLLDLTRKTTETIRTLAYHLRPPILDDLGLTAALQSLINQIESQTDIAIEFRAIGFKERLNQKIELILFRVIEECLTNIVKHSQASKSRIHLIYAFPKVVVTVEDNGKGFDKEKFLANSMADRGLGILSIQERVKFFKGQFEINSIPHSGTHIKIEIPLSEIDYE
ncbi:MAG: PAS domain S-box protein [Thermodesulfobacteriota bacterium]|nr:PAS domain S-box protein [Thermodesulfobacteriota bacterium]